MGADKLGRVWQVLGVVLILFGFYGLFFGQGSQSLIYLGGGSAALLLLARKRASAPDSDEGRP